MGRRKISGLNGKRGSLIEMLILTRRNTLSGLWTGGDVVNPTHRNSRYSSWPSDNLFSLRGGQRCLILNSSSSSVILMFYAISLFYNETQPWEVEQRDLTPELIDSQVDVKASHTG